MKNEVVDVSYQFALRVINMYKHLRTNDTPYELCSQILRCGTSIGANIAESKYSQSVGDFITKLTIALKEASETRFWLNALYDSGYLKEQESASMIADCESIIKLLTSIIKKTKENNNREIH